MFRETSLVLACLIICFRLNGHLILSSTQVSLNTVYNIESFRSDILHGRWDVILPQVAKMKIPQTLVEDLYEHIFEELVQSFELDTARELLLRTNVMCSMRLKQPARYDMLFQNLGRLNRHDSPCIPNISRDSTVVEQRTYFARALTSEVTATSSGRLLYLLSSALSWQRQNRLIDLNAQTYNLFHDEAIPETNQMGDKCITTFGKKTHVECACFSPDGGMLVTGSTDGFIEVWDWVSGNLKTDLGYQSEELLMMHPDAVLSLGFSKDGVLLASASRAGEIRVWQIMTGHCLRKFEQAHLKAVTSVEFSCDGHHILSSSLDASVCIHGLKSGKLIESISHGGCVNAARYSKDGTHIVTASSDGKVRVWEAKDSENMVVFSPPRCTKTGVETSILSVIPLSTHSDEFLLCANSNQLHIVSMLGCIKKTFVGRSDFLCCSLSPKDSFIHALGEDKNLYSFSTETGKLEGILNLCEPYLSGVSHHPHRNILASFSARGVSVWRI